MTMTASDRAIEPPVAKESREIATPGSAELTVAAIGASAGGLDALCAFFDHMPAQSGVAFVVVTHHHPKAPSLLPQILARHTRMPVVDARHRMELRADRVHVIPPGAGAALEDGRLLLDGVRAQERLVHPIDAFFRSVAREQGDRAIGVVLSGTGCDGSRGAEEIRRAGGLTIAQDAGAAYREMPQNAIAAGGIQQVLPVEECARAIAAHAARRGRATPRGAVDPLGADTENGALLAAVAARLRSVTGQDLTDYKEAVIRRRLGHRMLLRRIGSLAEYVRVLEAEPQEVEALWRAMLIGVTSFFRDPAAFESLGRALDELLAVKPANEVVRVWVAGCATGEEAFSIAIALRESMERIGRDFPVRVTATDLDPAAVEVARAGSFPEGAIAPLGPERVARFFLRQPGRYAIHPDILGQIEFSARPLADPPPFSDREPADLVSCRNVLIYLTDAAQRATLGLLHAALRPGGLLLLGRAERLGPLADRFEAVDQRWRIYRRTLSPGRAARRPAGPARPAPEPEEVTHAGIARLVAADFGPASALVDAAGEILQVHGAAARYLETPHGAPSRAEIAGALRAASETGQVVLRRGVRFRAGNDVQLADLRVRRIEAPDPLAGLFLVSFLPGGHPAAPPADPVALRQELEIMNQELSSMNDELRAANLDLESSLEAVNQRLDDLEAANAELTGRLAELSPDQAR